jgi:hypothetical protein
MYPLTRLKEWWKARQPRKLDELMEIEFDDERVNSRVIERMDPQFSQTFRWDEITRVCFQDAGMWGSDVLYIELRGRDKPVILLTEAKSGSEFFGVLCQRKFFPEDIWRRALGDTAGGRHSWPHQQ